MLSWFPQVPKDMIRMKIHEHAKQEQQSSCPKMDILLGPDRWYMYQLISLHTYRHVNPATLLEVLMTMVKERLPA